VHLCLPVSVYCTVGVGQVVVRRWGMPMPMDNINTRSFRVFDIYAIHIYIISYTTNDGYSLAIAIASVQALARYGS